MEKIHVYEDYAAKQTYIVGEIASTLFQLPTTVSLSLKSNHFLFSFSSFFSISHH